MILPSSPPFHDRDALISTIHKFSHVTWGRRSGFAQESPFADRHRSSACVRDQKFRLVISGASRSGFNSTQKQGQKPFSTRTPHQCMPLGQPCFQRVKSCSARDPSQRILKFSDPLSRPRFPTSHGDRPDVGHSHSIRNGIARSER